MTAAEGKIIRVMLVDDRADFRGAIAALVGREPDIEVVAQAGSISEARPKLGGVDVALVDRGLPDGDGLGLLEELKAASPGARFFALSATAEIHHPTEAIEAGADGVVDKLAPREELLAIIRGAQGDAPGTP